MTCTAGGTLTNKTEDEVLDIIKHLAICEKNIMVACVNLHNVHQDDDDPIHAFGAPHWGQSATSGITIMCPHCNHNVDYTEPMICDCITKVLQDSDIQLNLLGDTDKSIQELRKYPTICRSQRIS